jgi:hypothetical protein
VGIGPPKVLAAPKPVSSVMMSKTFGAPFGAVTAFGKSGVDSLVLRPDDAAELWLWGRKYGRPSCWRCASVRSRLLSECGMTSRYKYHHKPESFEDR